MIKWKKEVQVYRSVMEKCRYLLPMYNKLVGTNKIRLQKKDYRVIIILTILFVVSIISCLFKMWASKSSFAVICLWNRLRRQMLNDLLSNVIHRTLNNLLHINTILSSWN